MEVCMSFPTMFAKAMLEPRLAILSRLRSLKQHLLLVLVCSLVLLILFSTTLLVFEALLPSYQLSCNNPAPSSWGVKSFGHCRSAAEPASPYRRLRRRRAVR